MTAKEAIVILEIWLRGIEEDHINTMFDLSDYAKALELAIEALNNHLADPGKKVSFSWGQEDDLISRQAAIDLFPNDALEWDTKGGYIAPHLARRMIEELPSAQPEPSDAVYRLYKRAYEAGQRNAQPEPHYDEWCTDCKEYDRERHRCPRWNRVIRETLKDAQPEQPDIIRCKDCKHAGGVPNADGLYWCDIHDTFMRYCSDAERRGE